MRTIGAVLATGVLLFACTGVNHAFPLAWLAYAPLLAFVPGLSALRAWLAALAAAILGSLSLVIAYRDQLPPIALVAGLFLLALPLSIIASIWRPIARRGSPVLAIIAFPALVVSVEYLLSLLSPHGTVGSLAYSQSGVPAMLQMASVTGLWGISFFVALASSALAVGWSGRAKPAAMRAAAVAMIAALVVPLLFGAIRLRFAEGSESVRVGLVASDPMIRYFETVNAAEASRVGASYARQIRSLAAAGAEIIVTPEKFVSVTSGPGNDVRIQLAEAARVNRVTIVAGLNVLGDSENYNRAVVFAPNGSTLLEYDKQHLVPGLERHYRPGRALGLLPEPPRTGVAICKDLDFVPLGRAHGREGVTLLLVPAWDFVRDAWIHSRMAIVRGVENGYAVVRTAAEGRLSVSDAYGRVIAERESGSAPEVTLVATVTRGPGRTVYNRLGDWFAWLAIAVAVMSVILTWRGPRTGA